MNLQSIIINTAILFVGLFTALLAVYYVIKQDIQAFLSLKKLELNRDSSKHLLPLRIQAHERLIIFIDRINPPNLLVRLHQQGISIEVLQAGILNEIRSEYQHNITQQLYVSSANWQIIRKLKDDTIAMVNHAVQGLPSGANGIELSKVILQHMSTIEENPYDLTIEMIKRDISLMF